MSHNQTIFVDWSEHHTAKCYIDKLLQSSISRNSKYELFLVFALFCSLIWEWAEFRIASWFFNRSLSVSLSVIEIWCQVAMAMHKYFKDIFINFHHFIFHSSNIKTKQWLQLFFYFLRRGSTTTRALWKTTVVLPYNLVPLSSFAEKMKSPLCLLLTSCAGSVSGVCSCPLFKKSLYKWILNVINKKINRNTKMSLSLLPRIGF